VEIAICDDNKLFLNELSEQLVELQTADSILTFSNLDAFFSSLEEGKRYDLVFMDIEWSKDVAGMDAASELYKLSPATKVIYVTGRVDRYSQHIFLHRANMSGYLTKPVDTELLRANLQKVSADLPLGDQPSLVLRQKGTPVSIPLREICFVESSAHTISVHTEDDIITTYERLENIARVLPVEFCQCHKSYIVNMSRIRRFQASEILLKNGERIPVSRSKYSETKEAYFAYIGQKFRKKGI